MFVYTSFGNLIIYMGGKAKFSVNFSRVHSPEVILTFSYDIKTPWGLFNILYSPNVRMTWPKIPPIIIMAVYRCSKYILLFLQ